MGLADEISASEGMLYRRSGSAVCTVKHILDYLSQDDRSALERLIADKRVFGTSIAELLHNWSTKVDAAAESEKDPTKAKDLHHLAQLCGGITDQTVQRHRRQKCLCATEVT